MYTKMLVALDRSDFAEVVLDLAREAAVLWKIPEVDLLTVIEPVRVAAITDLEAALIRESEEKAMDAGKVYLSQVKEKLSLTTAEVKTFSVEGRAADEILKFIDANGVDLLVMSTHGRSGVTRWFLGSVAEKVVRRSNATVLLVPSKAGRAKAG